MSLITKYAVKAAANYSTVEFGSKAKAIRYARSIADSINDSAKVYAGERCIAWYRYTPNNGGKVYRANV